MENRVDLVTRLIHLLDERGWNATTVDELARAAGISRATFFRIYGSKEDLVFADHSVTLTHLEKFLAETDHDVGSAMREGMMLVFQYHLADEERALARHRLLKQSVQLRNRELLTSDHYERIFRRWLRRQLDDQGVNETAAIALSGAAVALCNTYLRRWLRDPSPRILEDYQREAQGLIQVLLSGYRSGGSGEGLPGRRPVTVVTVLGEVSDTEEICDAVRKALNQTSSRHTVRCESSSAGPASRP